MTFFHFINCAALGYVPYIIVYKNSGVLVDHFIIYNLLLYYIYNTNYIRIQHLIIYSYIGLFITTLRGQRL